MTAAIKEGSASSCRQTGGLTFADADASDKLVVGLVGQAIAYRSSAGVDLTSSLSPSQISTLLQDFTIPGGNLGRNGGSQSWSYALADGTLDFLAASEVIAVTSTIRSPTARAALRSGTSS